ncbi:iron chelate uptake ABC transporter family permease subunit [Prauserella halophila]|uniref:Iron chelate uptake ABC transporter family permease subunit n=1 Tax=Prauserella halophila TaxID=185641 RepID=A0ABP4GL07_9PSEU|nr:iron chelate uptake ABC transporter family permease subunit [Prauserella halophila]MCP2235215.1 iron complex transport system permease protein [Prauserella halophila]
MTPNPPTPNPPATDPPATANGRATRADVVRVSRARGRERTRTLVVSAGLAAAVGVVFLGSLAVGDFQIGIPDLLARLTGRGIGVHQLRVDYVLFDLRLPRAVTGLLVGLAFGLAGSVFQRLLRNPLASPDVLGISAGAGAAAVLAIVVFGASGFAVSAGAFTGALAAVALIYALAWQQGVSGYRLVLIGIGINAALLSAVSFLMTRADMTDAQQALLWRTGSLYDSSWEEVAALLGCLMVLVPAALLLARALPTLQLGDDSARGLGLPVERSRLALLLVATGLIGVGTAAAGPVAFVAFLSGPIASRLLGGARPGIAVAALVGALVTLCSDVAAQHLFGDRQFPVGVVTGAVGAPYLLWLLAKSNRAGHGE